MESPYTIMIVDDSADDRYLLKRYLKKTELTLVILETANGTEGIDLLLKSREALESQYPGIRAPVTLFLDINMPVMNGWEFLEELEKRHNEIELRPTIVLMYSTSGSLHDKTKSTNYDSVVNYIVKGDLTIEELKQKIIANNSSVAI